MPVLMIDRIISLLDRPGIKVVLKASVAFSRTDPKETINNFFKLGVRPSLVNVLIDFLNNRQMTVKFNSE